MRPSRRQRRRAPSLSIVVATPDLYNFPICNELSYGQIMELSSGYMKQKLPTLSSSASATTEQHGEVDDASTSSVRWTRDLGPMVPTVAAKKAPCRSLQSTEVADENSRLTDASLLVSDLGNSRIDDETDNNDETRDFLTPLRVFAFQDVCVAAIGRLEEGNQRFWITDDSTGTRLWSEDYEVDR